MDSWRGGLATAAIGLLAVCLAAGAASTTTLRAQAPAAAAALTFDVASITPNNSGEARQGVRFYPPSDRVAVTNMTLRRLIQDSYQLQEYEVAGGPSWIDADPLDIVASADASHSPPENVLVVDRVEKPAGH